MGCRLPRTSQTRQCRRQTWKVCNDGVVARWPSVAEEVAVGCRGTDSSWGGNLRDRAGYGQHLAGGSQELCDVGGGRYRNEPFPDPPSNSCVQRPRHLSTFMLPPPARILAGMHRTDPSICHTASQSHASYTLSFPLPHSHCVIHYLVPMPHTTPHSHAPPHSHGSYNSSSPCPIQPLTPALHPNPHTPHDPRAPHKLSFLSAIQTTRIPVPRPQYSPPPTAACILPHRRSPGRSASRR